jgi:DNA excision repair protein ERCC-1
MVDIPSHEECLRELSKTSLVNNVTVILCWSAAEAARYLELYKSYEHANFSAIRGQQATSYAEKLVEFVTVPRSINKADAVALVSTFGSLKKAVNADPEQVAVISGWGEKKVKAWCKAVDEPFRVKTAAKRRAAPAPVSTSGVDGDEASTVAGGRTRVLEDAVPIGSLSSREIAARSSTTGPGQTASERDIEAEEEIMMAAAIEESKRTAAKETSTARQPEQLSEGVAAALAKLREKG